MLCPNCGKDCDKSTASCPHCGNAIKEPGKPPKSKSFNKGIVISSSLMVVGVVIMAIAFMYSYLPPKQPIQTPGAGMYQWRVDEEPENEVPTVASTPEEPDDVSETQETPPLPDEPSQPLSESESAPASDDIPPESVYYAPGSYYYMPGSTEPPTPPSSSSTPPVSSSPPSSSTPPVSSSQSVSSSPPSSSTPPVSNEPSQPSQAESQGQTVYYTQTGSKYHFENPCGNGTYYPCTLSEALAKGLGPCEKCVLH